MKKLIVLLLMLGLVCSFAACLSDEADDKKDKGDVVDEDNSEDKEKEDESTTQDKDTGSVDEKPSVNENVEDKKPSEPKLSVDTENKTLLVQGESVTVDEICEFTLDYFEISDEVSPPTPDSYYSYYTADDGKTYADVCIAYKNLESSAKRADEIISGKLYYGSYYEFDGFTIIEEDNRGDFTYANISSVDPLTNEYLHYLFEIPDEINDGNGDIFIVLNIAGNEYGISVREGEKGAVGLANAEAKEKSSGSVADGELISVDGKAEFLVEFSGIKAKVEPPYPSSYYSYYEADEGKIYVEVCFSYKNLLASDMRADEVIKASLKYADKYDYSGFSTIEEENRGDFTYTNITSVDPLVTEYIHYLFEVPTEVGESEESIVVNFKVAGNDYSYTVR